jgi:hypothetical protein
MKQRTLRETCPQDGQPDGALIHNRNCRGWEFGFGNKVVLGHAFGASE